MADFIPNRAIYFQRSIAAMPRLLSQLDRQPFSRAYGSWHRNYWHHRLSDFSSSACQQGMLSLAILYTIERQENPYFQSAAVLEWIEASIRALLLLQHPDGSFDEWYPNEHGWAGPTGYVIYALCRTWELVGNRLPAGLGSEVLAVSRKACRFLRDYEEIDVLANHQAMALLAVAQAKHAFATEGTEELAVIAEDLLARVERSTVSLEGWSLEYDGADPGYQTATLSFLARVHRVNPDPRIEKLVAPMFEFVSCFFFGKESFAGTVGSRSTRNLFHLGLEYWASRFESARTLAAHSRMMLNEGMLLDPADQEDHYVIYRVPEFLETFLLSDDSVELGGTLPYARPGFRRVFERAGIVCLKMDDAYGVVNLRKGGALKLLLSNGRVKEDSGWVLQKGSGEAVTSSWVREDLRIEMSESWFRVSGVGTRVDQPLFDIWRMIAFRAALIGLGVHPSLARKFKSWIRSRIMTGRTPETRIAFSRELRVQKGELFVSDTIRPRDSLRLTNGWVGGTFVCRTVPQSRYFERYELEERPLPLSVDQLSLLREGKPLTIERSLL